MQVEPGISDYASDLDGLEASVNATPDIAHNTFQCARDDTGGARRCQFCYSRLRVKLPKANAWMRMRCLMATQC